MARRQSRNRGVLRRSTRTCTRSAQNEAERSKPLDVSNSNAASGNVGHESSESSPENVVIDVTASPEASDDDIVVIDLTSSTDSPPRLAPNQGLASSAPSRTSDSLSAQPRHLVVNPACPFRRTAFDSTTWDEGWCRLTMSAIRSFAPSILSIGAGSQSLLYDELMVVASFREWRLDCFTWEQLKRILKLLHGLFTSRGYRVPQKLVGKASSKKSLIYKIEGFLRFGGSSFEPCPIHSILREIGPIVPVCVCFKESVEEVFSARQHWMSSNRAALTLPESKLDQEQECMYRPVMRTAAYRELFCPSLRSKFSRRLSRVISYGPGHRPLSCDFVLTPDELSEAKSGHMKVILSAFNMSTESLIPFDLTTASYTVNRVHVSCTSPIFRGGVVISNLLRHNSVSIVHLESPGSHSMAAANKSMPIGDGSFSGSVMFEVCLLEYFDTVVHGPLAASECSFADNRPVLQLGVPTKSIREIATIRWVSPIDKPHVFKPALLKSEKYSIAAHEGVVIAHPFQDSSRPIRIDPKSFIGVKHMVGAVALGNCYLLPGIRRLGLMCSGSSMNFGRRDPIIYCTFYFVQLSLPEVPDSWQLPNTSGPLLSQILVHPSQRLAMFSVQAFNPRDLATVMLSCTSCKRVCPMCQQFSVYWNGHRLPFSLRTASSLVPMHALEEQLPSRVVVIGPRFKTCTVLVRVSVANPPPPSASRNQGAALLSAAHREVAVPSNGRQWRSSLNQSSTALNATVSSVPLSGEKRGVGEVAVDCSEVQVSLRCPLAMRRIQIPVKGSVCKHLQTFDYDSFVQYSQQRKKWICPICGLAASNKLLRVCVETQKALATMPESIDRIWMSSQGLLKGPSQPDKQCRRKKRPRTESLQHENVPQAPNNVRVKNEVPEGVDPLSGTAENPLCCF